jgi:very-short-patch-repair endonuclease
VERAGDGVHPLGMPTDDVELALLELAEQQHGLITRLQARELGTTRQATAQRLATDRWEPVTDAVVRRRGAPATTAQRALAAVLDAGPGSVLSHLSAASWWGLEGCSLTPLHVTRLSRSTRYSELAEVHVVRALPVQWTTVLHQVPIVRPELLTLQLFAVCRDERAERLVETLWAKRLLSGRSISQFLDHLGKRGRNGTAGLRRYLDARGEDYTPPATGLEARTMQVLRDEGIDLRPQVDSGGSSWTGRVDFRHPRVPLIVEVQSERYHSALVDRLADRRRLAALRAAGFVVVEVSDAQVWSRPWEVVEAVRRGFLEAQTKRPVLLGERQGSA